MQLRWKSRWILFAACSLLFCGVAVAQWSPQDSGVKARLRGVSAVSEKIAWASGSRGTCLRTIDGGATWQKLTVPDSEKLDFRDIQAFDANTAYILSIGEGEASRIYKTTDGGQHWNLQFTNHNPKAFFDAIAFWDVSNGLAMSDPVDGKFLVIALPNKNKVAVIDLKTMSVTTTLDVPKAPQETLVRPDGEEVVLNLEQHVADALVRLRDEGEPDDRIEFVDGPHGLDPGIVLRDAAGPEQARFAAVACARVEFRHHATQGRASFGAGRRGKRSG